MSHSVHPFSHRLGVIRDWKSRWIARDKSYRNALKADLLIRAIVAMMVAEGLEKRLPFRRVLKQTLEKVLASKEVKGAKIKLSGRLGGAEMARREDLKKGQIPLQTLRADIDYAREKAHMTYGDIGIKVWIYKGQIFEKDLKNIK